MTEFSRMRDSASRAAAEIVPRRQYIRLTIQGVSVSKLIGFILFLLLTRVKPLVRIHRHRRGVFESVLRLPEEWDLPSCNENSVFVTGTQHFLSFFTNTLQRFCGIATIATFTVITIISESHLFSRFSPCRDPPGYAIPFLRPGSSCAQGGIVEVYFVRRLSNLLYCLQHTASRSRSQFRPTNGTPL